MCFQEVAWLGLKQVWHQVIPMLKCWRILVSVRSLDGFDTALGNLEKLMVRPERIAFEMSSRAPDLDADRRRFVDNRGAQFYPP
jgi:hypothetical protein